jgi:hypothetical protein
MILEQLGLLAENEALTTASTEAVGYCLDLVSAYNKIGHTQGVWLVIRCTVAGSSGNSDGTFQFHVRKGTGTDGTDINAGNVDVITTDAIAEGDARVLAGAQILCVQLPYQVDLQYLQVWKTLGGTSPTISVDVYVSPFPPPTPYNTQAGPLTTKSPLGE